jgi:hypothetical protein
VLLAYEYILGFPYSVCIAQNCMRCKDRTLCSGVLTPKKLRWVERVTDIITQIVTSQNHHVYFTCLDPNMVYFLGLMQCHSVRYPVLLCLAVLAYRCRFTATLVTLIVTGLTPAANWITRGLVSILVPIPFIGANLLLVLWWRLATAEHIAVCNTSVPVGNSLLCSSYLWW